MLSQAEVIPIAQNECKAIGSAWDIAKGQRRDLAEDIWRQ